MTARPRMKRVEGHGGVGATDATTRAMLWAGLVGLLLVLGVAVFAPPAADDPTPATWNTGPQGAKVALLALGRLGYETSAWERPLDRLRSLPDASVRRTILVLAAPQTPLGEVDADSGALQLFLTRGGTVLTTGPSGAMLLRHPDVQPNTRVFGSLCLTTPEGQSPLARAGAVHMAAPATWGGAPTTGVVVAQRCGVAEDGSAVVVRYAVGAGTAIWWSSATPLTNAGLREDASLRLLLASLGQAGAAGPGGSQSQPALRRIVLFDESLHGAGAGDAPNPLAGLPLPLLLGQAAVVALLMVFSFSRRHGPVREVGVAARTSPLEFAASMGALYRRAGATSAPVEAAALRLRRALRMVAGVSGEALEAGAVAGMLAQRYGENARWGAMTDRLKLADSTLHDNSTLTAGAALTLVRGLDGDARDLPELVRQKQWTAVTEK